MRSMNFFVLSVLFVQFLFFTANAESEPQYLFEIYDTNEIIYIATEGKGAEQKYKVYLKKNGRFNEISIVTDSGGVIFGESIYLALSDGSKIIIPESDYPRSVSVEAPLYVTSGGRLIELIEYKISSESLEMFGVNIKNPSRVPSDFIEFELLSTNTRPFSRVNVEYKKARTQKVVVNDAYFDAYGNIVVVAINKVQGINAIQLYWMPHSESEFYVLDYRFIKEESKANAVAIEFDAPTIDEPRRKGRINFIGEGMQVSCAGGARCFKKAPAMAIPKIQRAIQLGRSSLLRPLEERKIEYVFKIEGSILDSVLLAKKSNRYLVIDSPVGRKLTRTELLTNELSGGHWRAYVGEPGLFRAVKITSIELSKENSPSRIIFLDGTELRFETDYGSILRTPRLSTIVSSYSLRPQPTNVDFIADNLLLSHEPYSVDRFKTPVDAMFMELAMAEGQANSCYKVFK